MPPESPPLFGLHPNTEIGYLTTSAESLLFNILLISKRSGVRETMVDLQSRLPNEFEMVSLTLVALQECGRMNMLLKEIRKSLSDLDKGLKGQLNMSQEMEDLITALKINQWPGRDPFSKCS